MISVACILPPRQLAGASVNVEGLADPVARVHV